MSEENGKVCCNCRHNIRTGEEINLVLFGIIKSPTFFYTWTAEEAKAFYDGFMEGLKGGNDD